ncbi:hypothetical protein R4I97_11755 [Brachyspira pilosicoli]|uniref:hypothetical protein n=1 Tax=Brachyspira pilosicoli TaxID=52584 RepID=UPI003005B4FB
MQKRIKILLTLLLMILTLAISCSSPNDPTENPNIPPDNEWVNNPNFTTLKQKWQDNDTSFGITQYIITDNKFDNLYDNTVSYSFDIKYISWVSETAGIIYGQYTVNDDNSVIGKWYAVSFKDLTATTIKICGASKQIGTDPNTEWGIYDFSAENLKEAISKFTEANGYFSYYSDCTSVK